METETLQERLARLEHAHRRPAVLQAEARRMIPCALCPSVHVGRLPSGEHRCEVHLPPQPTSGYCAPGRCYCATDSCERRP